MARNYVYELEQASVRVDCLLWVPGMLSAFDAPPEDLEDFCEWLPCKKDDQLYIDLPQLAKFADAEEYPSAEDALEALSWPPSAQPTGFLAKLSVPVTSGHSEDGSCFYSWGHTRFRWHYAKDMDHLTNIAVRWSAECRELDKKRAA